MALYDEVTALLRQGRKLEAVRRYREIEGVSLAEAKDGVEEIARGMARKADSDNYVSDATHFMNQIYNLLKEGRRDEAVDLYGQNTGKTQDDAAFDISQLAKNIPNVQKVKLSRQPVRQNVRAQATRQQTGYQMRPEPGRNSNTNDNSKLIGFLVIILLGLGAFIAAYYFGMV